MKQINFCINAFVALVFCIGLFACSGTDDDIDSFDDYYIECIDISGGSLTSSECLELKASFNVDLASFVFEDYEKGRAIKLFDEFMEELCNGWKNGLPYLPSTMKMKFALKNIKGTTIKTSTLTITKNNCTLK